MAKMVSRKKRHTLMTTDLTFNFVAKNSYFVDNPNQKKIEDSFF
jgi:hypothetical protein